jgi:FlaA1/EpsC-like NDP-sugar epimerase
LAPKYGYDPKNIEINVIGTKPGEKLYEELMSLEETRRAVELPRYFSVLPAFRGFYQTVNYDYEEQITDEVDNPYNSSNETPMTREDLRAFLTDNKLLENDDQNDADRRYWPGDKEDKNR